MDIRRGSIVEGYNGSAVCMSVYPNGDLDVKVVDSHGYAYGRSNRIGFKGFALGYFMVFGDVVLELRFRRLGGSLCDGAVYMDCKYVCDITESTYRAESIYDIIPDYDRNSDENRRNCCYIPVMSVSAYRIGGSSDVHEMLRSRHECENSPERSSDLRLTVTSEMASLWYPEAVKKDVYMDEIIGDFGLVKSGDNAIGVVSVSDFVNNGLNCLVYIQFSDLEFEPSICMRLKNCIDFILNDIYPMKNGEDFIYPVSIDCNTGLIGGCINNGKRKIPFQCDRQAWREGYPRFLCR